MRLAHASHLRITCLPTHNEICTCVAAVPQGAVIATPAFQHSISSLPTQDTPWSAACPGLHRQGYRARRIRPQGTLAGRNRNAGPDGDPRGIRPEAAAEGRAHRRLAAHDHPDRRADRDAGGARRRRALGRRATSTRRRITPPRPSPPPAFRCSRSRARA